MESVGETRRVRAALSRVDAAEIEAAEGFAEDHADASSADIVAGVGADISAGTLRRRLIKEGFHYSGLHEKPLLLRRHRRK